MTDLLATCAIQEITDTLGLVLVAKLVTLVTLVTLVVQSQAELCFSSPIT